MNALASATCLEPFGTATTSPPTKEETCPSFTPGRKVTPKFMFGHVVLELGEQEAAGALDADLAGLEHGGEIRAAVGLRVLRHEAFAPHLA